MLLPSQNTGFNALSTGANDDSCPADSSAPGARARGRSAGFTIIELMAVVAIISILAVIALAAYQDYVIRSKVSEGLGFAAEAKTSVTEYFYNTSNMPTSNGQAGLPDPDDYDIHEHIKSLEIRTTDPKAGAIQIEFKIDGLGSDNLLQLVPSTINNLVSWECVSPDTNGVEITKVPPTCRG